MVVQRSLDLPELIKRNDFKSRMLIAKNEEQNQKALQLIYKYNQDKMEFMNNVLQNISKNMEKIEQKVEQKEKTERA